MNRLLTGALILLLAMLALYCALRPQGHTLAIHAQYHGSDQFAGGGNMITAQSPYHGPPMPLQHIAPCITPPPGPVTTPERKA